MWQRILDRLEAKVEASEFHRWIRPLKGTYSDGSLHLSAPNRYVFEEIQSRLIDQISETAQSVCGQNIEIQLTISVSRDSKTPSKPIQPKPKTSSKLPFGLGHLNPSFTFGDYVIGDSNRFACAAAEAVSENPGARHSNPLFIYGNVGIGKTHLMQAVGHKIQDSDSSAKVGYVQASSYVESLLRQFRKKNSDAVEQFKTTYRSLDVLLVDDVHLFAGATASQNEFFNTFNQFLELNKQIIITCNQYYRELDQVEHGLKSRFGQGIAAPVNEPEFEHRVNILMSKAEKLGIELEDEVAYFIAEKVKPDVRELEGALNQLIAHHRFLGHPITIDMTKRVLRDMLRYNSRPLELEQIVQTTANFYGVRAEDVRGKSRKANLVRARHMAMMLSRDLTTKSLPAISKFFANRNHTSVIYACESINKLLDIDIKTANEYTTLKKTLNY